MKELVKSYLNKLSNYAKIDESDCWYAAPYECIPNDLLTHFEIICANNTYFNHIDFNRSPIFMSKIGFDYMAMFLWINSEKEIKQHLKSDRHTSSNDGSILSYDDFYSAIHCEGMGGEQWEHPVFCPITNSLLTNVKFDGYENYITELIDEINEHKSITPEIAYYILYNDLIEKESLINCIYSVLELNTQNGWIDANKEQPKLIENENYSPNVLAICDGQLMVMCYCYNPSEDEIERGYFWANCYGNIDGECEFDDEYSVTFWQHIPSIEGFVA